MTKTFTPFLVALAFCPFLEAGSVETPMTITSPDFGEGGTIPKRFTCDDQNVNPTLQFAGVPVAAKSLALIMDDPDAPGGTFTHWLLWNLPADLKEIVAASAPNNAIEGKNGFGKSGYGGPCPPSGQHRYYFRLYALDVAVKLPAGSSRQAIEKAMEGHVLNRAVVMGRYARSADSR